MPPAPQVRSSGGSVALRPWGGSLHSGFSACWAGVKAGLAGGTVYTASGGDLLVSGHRGVSDTRPTPDSQPNGSVLGLLSAQWRRGRPTWLTTGHFGLRPNFPLSVPWGQKMA